MSTLSNMLAAGEQAEAIDINQAAIWLRHYRKEANNTRQTKVALGKLIKKLERHVVRKNKMAAKMLAKSSLD